jgi:hypothetical protein
VVETSRDLIADDGFKCRHRWTEQAFTRVRSLAFGLVLIMVMRKSVKSLQNVVNEALSWLGEGTVTASAYSQARYKLKHTAFIELNEKAVVGTVYGDGDYRTFWDFRVLAVDGSKIVLPDSEDVCEEFGTIVYSNGQDAETLGERPYALASVLYDVLNRVALDAALGRADAYEVDLAVGHLDHTRPGDLAVLDRNYPSYRMLAEFGHRGREFVIRCSAASFAAARRMLKGEGPDSQVVTLTPCAGQAAAIRELSLPASIRVRFVRVRLETDAFEVLVTSLLDEARYPTEGFLELYGLRWGVEGFYGLLKTRLELENFTGTGAEAVRQDFHATVYLTGLESILTAPAQARLDAKETRHPQTVNRAVSFNAIKNEALDLLLGSFETEALLERLTDLFLKNPTLERKERKPPRKKSSARVLLDFHKRQKKHCF